MYNVAQWTMSDVPNRYITVIGPLLVVSSALYNTTRNSPGYEVVIMLALGKLI